MADRLCLDSIYLSSGRKLCVTQKIWKQNWNTKLPIRIAIRIAHLRYASIILPAAVDADLVHPRAAQARVLKRPAFIAVGLVEVPSELECKFVGAMNSEPWPRRGLPTSSWVSIGGACALLRGRFREDAGKLKFDLQLSSECCSLKRQIAEAFG
jgi:hypothetical protein